MGFYMKTILLTLAFFAMTSMLTSCGTFSNMSEQEAYDTGYAIGRTVRQIQDSRR